ncbi:NAD(+) diphosphatase [Palleronia sp. KMU-117]|uniref:NAD(+) diphosphatase n=1 Tax=Palleronia sp. KMU-117 TaxID=3434108 RepID=UPI003D754485
MRRAETVTFGGSSLDRAGDLRADSGVLARLLESPGTRVLPLWRGKPLVVGEDRRLGLMPFDTVLFREHAGLSVFLGREGETTYFAMDLSAWEPDEVPDTLGAFLDPSEQRHPALPATHVFAELRAVMMGLSPREAELAATAKAILGWHSTHGFCARCGAPTIVAQGGWQRTCNACGAHHFPRTDPVAIMLITHGNDVLLGRSPGWPEGMFSLLAGFVEPGETLEGAVRREVFEEAGVRVGRVDYLASQPWPFPSSLMFGCRGEALTREITIDPAEIESARWVSREDIAAALAGQHPEIRPARKGAIAQFLLSHWVADRLD